MAKKDKNEEKLDKDSVKKLLEFGGELSSEIKKEQSVACISAPNPRKIKHYF